MRSFHIMNDDKQMADVMWMVLGQVTLSLDVQNREH
jgi:hypothetical protein